MPPRIWPALTLIVWVVCGPITGSRQDLGKSTWTVSSQEDPPISNVPVQVPGGIYTDLTEAGVLPHPNVYHRFADEEYKWVARRNWTYQAKAGFIFGRIIGEHLTYCWATTPRLSICHTISVPLRFFEYLSSGTIIQFISLKKGDL